VCEERWRIALIAGYRGRRSRGAELRAVFY
jgi:hypothetical protein